MVKVGNQGLDHRYIRLRSHRTSYPGLGIASVSFDHVFETRFSNVRLDILKLSFHHSSTNFRLKPELVSRPRPRTSNAPGLAKGNL